MKNIPSKKTIVTAIGVAGFLAAYQAREGFFDDKVKSKPILTENLEPSLKIEEIKQKNINTATGDSIVQSSLEIQVESQKIKAVDTFLKAPRSSTPIKKIESPRLYSDVPASKKKSPDNLQRRVSSVDVKEEWNISLLYGAKYLSITQKVGTIDANLGIVYPSNVQLVSELICNDWSTWFRFDTYEFSYETTTSKDKDRLSSVELGLSQKWLMGALGIEQNPLFNMSDEIIGLARQSTTYVALGAQKAIELPTQKPTSLNVKAWFSYPIATSSSNADVELSNITGFGIRGQVEFNRQIVKRPDYSLYATWSTNVGYQKIEQDLKWGNLDDKVKSTIIGASSTIGLQLKF
jgi:hypothetical protein